MTAPKINTLCAISYKNYDARVFVSNATSRRRGGYLQLRQTSSIYDASLFSNREEAIYFLHDLLSNTDNHIILESAEIVEVSYAITKAEKVTTIIRDPNGTSRATALRNLIAKTFTEITIPEIEGHRRYWMTKEYIELYNELTGSKHKVST